MNDYSIRLAKPHCQDCHQSKGHITDKIVDEMAPVTDKQVQYVKDRIEKKDPIAEMRARLSGNPTHGNLAANLEEEDI